MERDPDAAYESLKARVAARLRELRKARGLSQEQVAALTGMAPRHVQRAEAGVANLGLQSLARFAVAFEVDVADLLSRAE